jgi:hypothetical protein
MKMKDSDYGTQDKRAYINKVERSTCQDCGTNLWHDLPQSFVCTNCLKTIGKSWLEEHKWQRPCQPNTLRRTKCEHKHVETRYFSIVPDSQGAYERLAKLNFEPGVNVPRGAMVEFCLDCWSMQPTEFKP